MAKASNRKRSKPKDNGRKAKKKISPLSSEKVEYVDYKDVDLLRRFMSDRAKIRSRRVSGNDSQQQREVARAIKNAREMGLLAYTSRVTTQRRGGGRNRDDRGGRGEGRGGRDGRDGRDGDNREDRGGRDGGDERPGRGQSRNEEKKVDA
jgi:small subunit ribosomal protein S18